MACKKAREVLEVKDISQLVVELPTFSTKDMGQIHTPHEDALVINIQIAHATVSKVLVDNEAAVNVLFKQAIERMVLIDDITAITKP